MFSAKTDKENLQEKAQERVKESPLSKLNPPLKINPILNRHFPTLSFKPNPLSAESYLYIKRELTEIIKHVNKTSTLDVDQICNVMIEEIKNLKEVDFAMED